MMYARNEVIRPPVGLHVGLTYNMEQRQVLGVSSLTTVLTKERIIIVIVIG